MAQEYDRDTAVPSPATLRGRLNDRKSVLEQQLAEVNEALTALDKYPEVGTLMDLLGRWNSGRY